MSDDMKEKEITIMKIGFFASLWSDIRMFSTLMGAFYLNHQFIDGNNFLDAIFTCMAVAFLIIHTSPYVHKFKTNEEAINFLKKEDFS